MKPSEVITGASPVNASACGRYRLSHWLILGLCLLMPAMVLAQDVTTSFEFTNTSGEFTLGTAPNTITFTNGEAKSIGNFSLYHTGLNAWMVDSGNTGTVTFNTPADSLELFIRDENGGNQGLLTVFGADDTILATFNNTNTTWTQVTLTATGLGQPIARMTLANNGFTGYSVIDDLTYTAAEPGPTVIGAMPGIVTQMIAVEEVFDMALNISNTLGTDPGDIALEWFVLTATIGSDNIGIFLLSDTGLIPVLPGINFNTATFTFDHGAGEVFTVATLALNDLGFSPGDQIIYAYGWSAGDISGLILENIVTIIAE